MFHSWIVYFLSCSFVLGWWILAFYSFTPSSASPLFFENVSTNFSLKTSVLLEELSPLQRDSLHQALAGDFSLMLDFIVRWNGDAQHLVEKGFKGIQLLPKDDYHQALILGKLLQYSSRESLRELNQKMNVKTLQDDKGKVLEIFPHFHRFLPQTYLAASFLLAIAYPEEIAALPNGLRYLPQFQNCKKLTNISQDMHLIHGEKLHLIQPHLAFIAPYSHPSIIETLKNQNILLYSIDSFNGFKEIENSLLKIGHATHHILEAQFLAIFMRACLISIDNRLQALSEHHAPLFPSYRLLYLSHHQHYTLLTTQSLAGQLMTHALKRCPHLSCLIPDSGREWRIPFEQEKILEAEPDYLVVSLPHYSKAMHKIPLLPALKESKAYQSQHVSYLDEMMQEFPSQYFLLGYFDLFQTLAATYPL